MVKGKALRRALETKDAMRITGEIPLIVDTTELITPAIAQEMLKHNKTNRPINWRKVEEYSDLMANDQWKLHSQGIIFDPNGNILTGQKRLWAVVYSGKDVLMRVSRGCPADTVRILDRGTPQTARDMAARETKRKHTAVENSIVRGFLVLNGYKTPSPDKIADVMIEKSETLEDILTETKGTKKTRAILMILGAACFAAHDRATLARLLKSVEVMASKLEKALAPATADKCWGRGVAFVMAMDQAIKVVNGEK